MSSRICPDCGRLLPLNAFYKDRSRKDGHTLHCKECKCIRMGQVQPSSEGLALKAKRCPGCAQTLPREAFGVNHRRWDGLQFYCNRCRHRHPKYQWVDEYKEKVQCADCPAGTWHPAYRLDLHHVRGVKVASVSNMFDRGFSLVEIETEIAKCDVVCANCHRDRHYAGRHRSSTNRGTPNGFEESPVTLGLATDS